MNHATLTTPVGPLTLAVAADGAVTAAGFTDDLTQLLAAPPERVGSATALRGVVAAVTAYLDGDLTALDRVPVQQPDGGGPVLLAAWRMLRQIPAGRTVTYTALAAAAGRPAAVRTAASACARNPAALFVPCHRVLRSNGGLGGYRWGLSVKRWLLAHEQRHCGYSVSAAPIAMSAATGSAS